MKLIRKGKVKEVYALDSERLLFLFTDNISVFDKIIPSKIPKKGESLCRTSAFWFEMLKKEGIENHYLSCQGNTMEVRRFKILDKPTKEDEGYLIPLEFITRYYIAGSMYDRIKSGKMDYRELGFSRMPEYGEPLPEPYFEITTKFEAYDRKVDFKEAREIGGLEQDEIDEIREIILKIDEMMAREVEKRNLLHVDGKKEFALSEGRDIVVVDTFGTLDEDRWWDKEEYEKGNIVQLSKEFVRQYYRETGYYEKLKEARERGLKEPEIPPLPEEMIIRVSKLYMDMYERITGRRF
ncbi:phosphoribosylaminoimidazolesuccinocarboxamide synthase [Euryarchaeota archaeon ex4484_178]|nr:MAG: phosphoribosylaminoimidazolesuccinocarboxamide synthase [Euryarchaeota archaeon ex4484_178]